MPPPVGDGRMPPMHSSLESYVHQEPLSPESYPVPDTVLQSRDYFGLTYNFGSLSVDEKKELILITQNSVDLLSSLLNTETEPKPIKVITLLFTMKYYSLTFIRFSGIV